MSKQYTKLESVMEYDHEKVDELAAAMMELKSIESRSTYLKELIKDHKGLTKHIWGTLEGTMLPHHAVEDDHLKNIMTHCIRGGRRIPKGIKAEARKRGFDVPDDTNVGAYISGNTSSILRPLPQFSGIYGVREAELVDDLDDEV